MLWPSLNIGRRAFSSLFIIRPIYSFIYLNIQYWLLPEQSTINLYIFSLIYLLRKQILYNFSTKVFCWIYFFFPTFLWGNIKTLSRQIKIEFTNDSGSILRYENINIFISLEKKTRVCLCKKNWWWKFSWILRLAKLFSWFHHQLLVSIEFNSVQFGQHRESSSTFIIVKN